MASQPAPCLASTKARTICICDGLIRGFTYTVDSVVCSFYEKGNYMTDEIITRRQAVERGLTQYFTGKPCPHGHLAKRNTVTAACTKCVTQYQRKTQTAIYNKLKMEASNFEKQEILIHPIDLPMVKRFISFINESRFDSRRMNDIRLIDDYICALKSAWNLTN